MQVERNTNKNQTKLDKAQCLFEQTNFIDDRKIVKKFTHEIDIEEIKLTAYTYSSQILIPRNVKKKQNKKHEAALMTYS